jgi:hypothetical protein
MNGVARGTMSNEGGTFLGSTVINEWYIPWVSPDKQMVHSLGWEGQEEVSWWKSG